MQPIHRRNFIKQTGAAAALAAWRPASAAAATAKPKLTDPAEIRKRVQAAQPLLGGMIPNNLKDRLGATHYDGHYFLTDKPFLLEGAAAIRKLGMGVGKFWLSAKDLVGYGYHSDWKLSKTGRLVDVLRHPYFVETLEMPFSTVIFEIFPVGKTDFLAPGNDHAEEEAQFHEVATHLMKTYADREMTFILQNWEGDWMLRGNAGGGWGDAKPERIKQRCEGFIHWLAARQKGVERARAEFGASSRCKVYHAAEVNRVWDGTRGIPTLTTHVLPQVTLDLVSWSCYDGMSNAVSTWQGVELIRQAMRPSPVFGENAVFIGEVGKPENEAKETEIIEWWDRAMGVFLALELPWIIHWELYCNEPKDLKKEDRTPRDASQMRGFWLLRPDGSLSHAGRYLTTLLENSGKRLPDELIRSFR